MEGERTDEIANKMCWKLRRYEKIKCKGRKELPDDDLEKGIRAKLI